MLLLKLSNLLMQRRSFFVLPFRLLLRSEQLLSQLLQLHFLPIQSVSMGLLQPLHVRLLHLLLALPRQLQSQFVQFLLFLRDILFVKLCQFL